MTDQIPDFEGRHVDAVTVKVSGSVPVEDLTDVILGIDDRVQLLSTWACVKVEHGTDKDGKLVRVQTLKPQEMNLLPFDEDNPEDNGIVRALPVGTTTLADPEADEGDD